MEIDFQDEKNMLLEVISHENSKTSSFPWQVSGFSSAITSMWRVQKPPLGLSMALVLLYVICVLCIHPCVKGLSMFCVI